ncbi:MFS general substrate transporter [Coprinellus micaceus]|uniref:MFS general substrate transporter n=1 Tax=Coprinellus micaceus TaxID=71717 RepID=A0A4Y7RKA2_COPMI|nr:MFS general substrate transporter [Coprinellus micaceus]
MFDGVPSQTASPPPSPRPNGGTEFLDLEGKSATDGGKLVAGGKLREKVESYGSQTPRTRKQIVAGNVQCFSLCFSYFLIGWNSGSTGPLLPRIQSAYGVSYVVGSLIFILSCVGYLCGAFMNVWITDKLGFGKSVGPPFAWFIFFNVVNGIGIALQDSHGNGFVGSLTYSKATKRGIYHAAYGLGAFASPFVATQFSHMNRWSFHYFTSLGLAVCNTFMQAIVFRFRDHSTCLLEGGENVHALAEGKDTGKLKQIISHKAVHFLGFFVMIYYGVEVTIGRWIVTYIIDERHGGPNSGYISSGFFGGLTLGRVILLPINKWLGEHRVFYIYALLSLGLELVIWFVPSLVGSVITVSVIGLLFGPIYPISMNRAARILPPWILTGAMGWIGGFGTCGSALVPFITGAIAQEYGIKSLHPVYALFLLWRSVA